MNKKRVLYLFISSIAVFICIYACNSSVRPADTDIASSPEELNVKTTDNINQMLAYASNGNGHIGDSVFLFNTGLDQKVYAANEGAAIWSSKEQWKPVGDSLLTLIKASKYYGLFPEDYHFLLLDSISNRFSADTLANTDRRDAVLWAKADVLLTDAFVHILKDIKLGRLPQDSVTLRKDSVLSDSFYLQQLQAVQQGNNLTAVVQSLEPQHKGYQLLKAGIPKFLDSADNKVFTKVPSPGKEPAIFKKALQKRLYEGGFIAFDSTMADSVTLAEAVKKFQKQKGITVDGKAGEGTVRILNTNDKEKFARIAITLDRYKLLPAKMPERYIWVNLPSYHMKLMQEDTVKLYSKIICGKPHTRTPVLNSAISELITYPQWTIPTSIIVKEILPAVKRNPGYLARKGFSLINGKGDEVDPYSVDWSKYSKGIPYRVVQGSGDANALGILKFNFPNKYAVYLHDTNQRYLFGQAMRSLSHGCVRVQEWEKLARSIVQYDSRNIIGEMATAVEDSMSVWLKRKEKHSITVKNRLPVYIRYFTCEGKEAGGISFFDDIYGEDKWLREKYLAGK
jgi:murein L,D-transpeptidase YcbB/YkuD